MDVLAVREMKKALVEKRQLRVEVRLSRELPPTFKAVPVK